MSEEVKPPTYNPHLPCELQGGHVWSEPIKGKNINETPIMIQICKNCGKVPHE